MFQSIVWVLCCECVVGPRADGAARQALAGVKTFCDFIALAFGLPYPLHVACLTMNSIKHALCQPRLEAPQSHRQRVMRCEGGVVRRIGDGWESTAGQWLVIS